VVAPANTSAWVPVQAIWSTHSPPGPPFRRRQLPARSPVSEVIDAGLPAVPRPDWSGALARTHSDAEARATATNTATASAGTGRCRLARARRRSSGTARSRPLGMRPPPFTVCLSDARRAVLVC
jgi:hypothetical protein